jgi:hypothetical protein
MFILHSHNVLKDLVSLVLALVRCATGSPFFCIAWFSGHVRIVLNAWGGRRGLLPIAIAPHHLNNTVVLRRHVYLNNLNRRGEGGGRNRALILPRPGRVLISSLITHTRSWYFHRQASTPVVSSSYSS